MKEMVRATENFVLLDVNLQSFDEGAAAGSASSEGGQTDRTGSNSGVAPTGTKEQKIVYGKQENSETENVDTKENDGEDITDDDTTPPDLTAEFEKLIGKDGQYKEQYDARVQAIVKDRLKKMKGLEQQIGESQPVLDLLREKYGVENTKDLLEKVEGDYLQELAYNSNMTPEEIKAARANTAKAKLYDTLMKNQKKLRKSKNGCKKILQDGRRKLKP